jgi:hypothetical protein
MYTYVSSKLRERGVNKRYIDNPVFNNVPLQNVQMRNIFKRYVDGWFTLIPPQYAIRGTTNPSVVGLNAVVGAIYYQVTASGNVVTRWQKGNGGATVWTDIGTGGHTSIYVYLNLVTLKMSGVKKSPILSFSNWLASLTNNNTGLTTNLPTVTDVPTYTTTRVLYSDAFKAQYDVQRVHPTAPPANPYPLGDKTDLLIGKVGVNPTTLYENCLFTVNGLFHMSDLTIYGVKIKEGGRTCDVSGQNKVGILSFREIGTVQQIPIDSSMLGRPSNLYFRKNNIWLKTGVDMTNKTAMLVLGGYLHVVDNIYSVVNAEEGIIQINISQICLMHRMFESKKIIDLTSLGLPEASYNEDLVVIQGSLPDTYGLYDDRTIENMIDLSQSFVVLVDTPTLYTEKHLLSRTDINGVYLSPEEARYPIRGKFGAFPEYWQRKEYDQWVLSIDDGLTPNYLFETTQWQNMVAVDNTLDSSWPYTYMIAHLFEIGHDEVTLV